MLPLEILTEDGRPLAPRAWATQNTFERAHGWLGRDGVEPGEGLLIVPCASIHSVGMRFAFDLAYLDRRGRVLKMRAGMRPGRLSWGPWKGLLLPWSVQALELPAGTLAAAGVAVGQRLQWRERPA